AAPALALGMSSGARKTLERRLTMIMRDSAPCRLTWKSLAAVGLLALLAAPGWSGESAPQKNGDEKQAKPDPGQPVKVQVQAKDVLQSIEGVLELQLDDVQVEQAKEDPNAQRERRLEQLEKQLQALLKEVQELRGKGAKSVQGEQVQRLRNRL